MIKVRKLDFTINEHERLVKIIEDYQELLQALYDSQSRIDIDPSYWGMINDIKEQLEVYEEVEQDCI